MINRWTVEETETLKRHYSSSSRQTIEKLLPNRAWGHIQQKAEGLGIRRTALHVPWTERQIAKLKVLYPSGTRTEELVKALRHSPEAIKTAASRLQIRRERRQVPRTPSRREWWYEGSLLGHLSEAEKGYIAGIFDGEGTIGLRVDRGQPRSLLFKVTTTDPFLVEWLKKRITVGMIYDHPAYGPNRKHVYNFRLTTVPTIKFCQEIAPYLVIKRAEAELIAEALKAGFSPLTKEERFHLRDTLRTLKTKAKVIIKNPLITN